MVHPPDRPKAVTTTTKTILRTGSVALVVLAISLTAPSVALAGGAGPATGSSDPPTGALPGIDVSHWQDEIDWQQVADAGISFAIAKATQGRSYVDPTYETNKAGAEAAGIAFTAYHFAEPDATPHDAVAEADHFVAVAGLGPGNLVPALDLERTGGLSSVDLTRWVLRWLDRVTELTGVRPMVYTSPNGWSVRTADTSAVADAGYAVLWLAHWDVPEPTVPGLGWGGDGWTFWQFSDCVFVPGIEGCVDGDWFGGASLDELRIAVPDVTPPIATISSDADVGRPAVISFSEPVRGVGADNVLLSQPDTAQLVPLALSCADDLGAAVDCASGPVSTVAVEPREPLVAAQRYSLLVGAGAAARSITDAAGNAAAEAHTAFVTPSAFEQDTSAVAYRWRGPRTRPDPWRTLELPSASAGSASTTKQAGASASFTFSGTGVRWTTIRGPKQGRAAVYVDGRLVRVVDDYADATTPGVVRTIDDLIIGIHTVRIVALGRARTGAAGAFVSIDRLSVIP